MTIWRAGMKAVCIKRDAWSSDLGKMRYGPSFQEIVTIKRVENDVDGVWLVLREYDAPNAFGGDYLYVATRFRPVTERKSENKNFEVLRDLLKNPNKVLEEA